MIIDQLPLLSGDLQSTDEIPIERGTTTYKTTVDKITVPTDAAPTQGSTNPVQSGGVYDALQGKQNALTFDSAPTQGSSNPVTSGGVYDALQTLQTSKQDTLVSGTNIKTVGGQSLLGSGNIDVGGGLYLTNVAVTATAGDIATVNNSEITANHVVAECVFTNPSAITTDVTWTTAAGSLVLNGTCTAATTVNIVLVKKNN